MRTKTKLDFLVLCNVVIALILLAPYFPHIPGDSNKIVSQSKQDVQAMTGLYNLMAEDYNEKHPDVSPSPLFNKSTIARIPERYGGRSLKETIALKNEGTVRFEIAYAAALGSDSETKIAYAAFVLGDQISREMALQRAATEHNRTATISGGGLLLFILIIIQIKRKSREVDDE